MEKRTFDKTPWLLLLPILAGVGLFFLIPFGITLYYSVTFGVTGRFVGLRNFAEVLSSSAFRLAAGNTLRFLALGVPLNMVLAFFLALLVRKPLAGARLFRSGMLLPMVVGVASVVTLVNFCFGDGGLWGSRLEGEPAFWILEGVYLWKNCGYNIVLFLAGLNTIPGDLYDYASLEGAGGPQKLRCITLPMMVPTGFFVFVISVINCFKTYREAFLLAGEHPDERIYMLQHFLSNNFRNLNYQRLSVAAVCLFALIGALTAVFYRFQRRYEDTRQ